MYIGTLSELTGASRKAIRLYEELGLLPAPERRGKYRIYTPHHQIIITMIKRAQSAGFKLSELHRLVELKMQTGQFPVDFAIEQIDKKREELLQNILKIQQAESELQQLKAHLYLLNQP